MTKESVIFEGAILKIIRDAIAYLDTQIKEKTYLGRDGIFVTEEEYPRFVRQELIVNAVTHRAYSISGTDIQIKMFDNHIVVESPGKLPGLVRADNIRYTHFSRNPKIAEYLKAYDFVKEYGEGVDRMCMELGMAGLKEPEYRTNAFMLQSIIYNKRNVAIEGKNVAIEDKKIARDIFVSLLEKSNYSEPTRQNLLNVYDEIEANRIFGTAEVAEILGFSYAGARRVMTRLADMKVLTAIKGKGKGKYRFLSDSEIGNM